MNKPYKNLINGRWVECRDAVQNVNPSNTNDILGEYAQGSAADVDEAVSAAKAAFPTWRASSLERRHDVLKKASDELLARKEELGFQLSREEGKILADGVGEVVRAAQVFDFYAGECLRLGGEIMPSVRPGVVAEMTREPVGIVGVITPWNFPIAIPAWKVAPALAWGNCVVFKPAELVPASAWAMVDILQRAGLPDGVLNLVMGRGSVVGRAMLAHEDISAISFTGSVPTGRIVAEACVTSRRMKKVQLEMGGKNPLVVLDDADLATAIEVAVNGAFFATGQRCTASSRLIVQKGIHDRFVAGCVERLGKLVVDDAVKDGTNIGPVVDQRQLDQDLGYIRIAEDEGAKLAFGGKPLRRDNPGFYFQPALFTDTDNRMRISREEVFGPVANVICVDSYDEALHVANDTEFGLSSGICTTSLKHASHFKQNSEAGLVMTNLPTAGVDYHVPFGGRKNSSYGPREQGRYAAEFYTNVKTAYTNP